MKRAMMVALALIFMELAALGVLFWASPAQAGQQVAGTITTSGANCNTPTNCVILGLDGDEASASITISTAFTGTIQFEVFADSSGQSSPVNCVPPNSSTAVTSATAPGIFTCPVAGMNRIDARASALSAGSPNITLQSSKALSTNQFSSGTGGGVATVSGTANQIDSTGGANPVLSLDAAITLPGNLTVPTGGTLSASGSGVINATQLGGATFASPGAIGGTTPAASTFTSITISGAGAITSGSGQLTIGGTSSLAGIKNNATAHLLFSPTAPVIGTCGTSPSIVAQNGASAFTVNVGTGGTATTCTVTMPAATTGWGCSVAPNGAPQAAAEVFVTPTSTTSITISNFTATTAVALAFPSGAVYNVNCVGY